jgi:hypothetical protein
MLRALTLIYFCKDGFIYLFRTNLVIAKCDNRNRLVCVMDKQHKCFMFNNRRTYLLVLESTKIYIKIHTKTLLHISIYDHHQGARS